MSSTTGSGVEGTAMHSGLVPISARRPPQAWTRGFAGRGSNQDQAFARDVVAVPGQHADVVAVTDRGDRDT